MNQAEYISEYGRKEGIRLWRKAGGKSKKSGFAKISAMKQRKIQSLGGQKRQQQIKEALKAFEGAGNEVKEGSDS